MEFCREMFKPLLEVSYLNRKVVQLQASLVKLGVSGAAGGEGGGESVGGGPADVSILEVSGRALTSSNASSLLLTLLASHPLPSSSLPTCRNGPKRRANSVESFVTREESRVVPRTHRGTKGRWSSRRRGWSRCWWDRFWELLERGGRLFSIGELTISSCLDGGSGGGGNEELTMFASTRPFFVFDLLAADSLIKPTSNSSLYLLPSTVASSLLCPISSKRLSSERESMASELLVDASQNLAAPSSTLQSSCEFVLISFEPLLSPPSLSRLADFLPARLDSPSPSRSRSYTSLSLLASRPTSADGSKLTRTASALDYLELERGQGEVGSFFLSLQLSIFLP